jgi:hypothetical protein
MLLCGTFAGTTSCHTTTTCMLLLMLQEHRSMPELPSTLWADILQHLDQQQRLLHCSSVSRSLQAAAAAATTELNVRIEDDKYCPAEVYNGAGEPIELNGSARRATYRHGLPSMAAA